MANALLPTSPAPAADPASVAASAALCPGCGQAVDPLRAGHVAVLEGRFRYFCHSECKQAYLSALGRPREEDVATVQPPLVARAASSHGEGNGHAPVSAAVAKAHVPTPVLDKHDQPDEPPAPREEPPSAVRPTLPSPVADAAPPVQAATEAAAASPRLRLRRERRVERAVVALDAAGIVLGLLAPAIGLLGPAGDGVRVPLIVGAWCALALRMGLVRRDPAEPHPLVVL